MELNWPSFGSQQQRQEPADDQISVWSAGGRFVISQQTTIVTSARGDLAALANLGPDAEEKLLLTAARMGHPTAFGDLVERHARRIRRVAFRITRNHEDAEDAVQECFKSAFTHINSFRGLSRFSTWLTRIAVNCALMKIRARRHEVVPFDDSIETLASVNYQHSLRSTLTPEEGHSQQELESILAEEMARLQPKLRTALHLYLVEGLISRDAAKVLGISNAALKARVHRARLALRSSLNRRGIGRRPSTERQQISSTVLDQGKRTSGQFYCYSLLS